MPSDTEAGRSTTKFESPLQLQNVLKRGKAIGECSSDVWLNLSRASKSILRWWQDAAATPMNQLSRGGSDNNAGVGCASSSTSSTAKADLLLNEAQQFPVSLEGTRPYQRIRHACIVGRSQVRQKRDLSATSAIPPISSAVFDNEDLLQPPSAISTAHLPAASTAWSDAELDRFCICNAPDDGRGNMLCCDHCEEWFHFHCIGMVRKKDCEAAQQSDFQFTCFNCCEARGVDYPYIAPLAPLHGKVGEALVSLAKCADVSSSMIAQETKQPRKQKKVGKKGPRKPTTSFMFFRKSMVQELKVEKPLATFGELATDVAARWKALTSEEKEPFDALGAEDKARYQKDMLKAVAVGGDPANTTAVSGAGAGVIADDATATATTFQPPPLISPQPFMSQPLMSQPLPLTTQQLMLQQTMLQQPMLVLQPRL
jgi:hypothetical protein